jgi:hypothetical protein
MALFTLTINNLSPVLDKRHSEVERVRRYLVQAQQDVGAGVGTKTTGNVTEGSTVVGSWTYTPQASS